MVCSRTFTAGFRQKFKGRPDATVYGVMWDSTNSSPVLRRVDQNGDNITLSQSDFDTHAVWNRKRCSIDPTSGNVTYGSNPRGDGLDYANAGYIMVEQKQAHISSWTDGDWRGWCLADKQFVGEPLGRGNAVYSEVHPVFNQRGHVGNPALKYYAGAYGAAANGANSLFSKKGTTVLVSVTVDNLETTRANTIGPGWGITNVWYWALKQLLMYIEYKTFNIQSALGQGFTAAGNTAPQTTGANDGSMGLNGSFGGTNTQSAIYRGEDAVYGGFWDFLVGLNATASQYNILNADGSGSANGKVKATLAAGEFTAAGVTPLQNSTTGVDGYIRNLANTPATKYLFIPTSTSGASDSTYLCDYFYTIRTNAVPSCLLGGGHWSNASIAGPGCLTVTSAVSLSSTSVGGRLEFIPPTA